MAAHSGGMTTATNTPTADNTDGADDVTAVVDTYLAAWNATDRDERAALVEQSLGADLWYRDGALEADDRDTFAVTLGAVQEAYPGHVMQRTSAIDAHHDVVRFNWAFARPGEAPTFGGVDVAKLDADGKLHRIVGFFGETATPL
jgi:hypothetical protein